MMNKILLINPPLTIREWDLKGKACVFPLGLAYLAAVLEKEWDVTILDCILEGYSTVIKVREGWFRHGLSFKEIKNRIEMLTPHIVGITSMFTDQTDNVHQLCRLIKEIDSDILTVLGGAHPSSNPQMVMEDRNVDFLILGEGEDSFLQFLESVKKEKEFFSIDGLVYRDNGRIKVNPKTRFIENIDRIPFPARHLLPFEEYLSIGRPTSASTVKVKGATTMITSRGCPARCIFCVINAVWGYKYRARSPENVLAEIKHLVERYRVNEIHFEDDNVTFDRDRMERICDGIIEQGLKIRWATPNGIALWSLDEDLLVKMRESGCYKLNVAIESGDEYVLNKLIRKPLKLSKVKSLIGKMKELGIETYGFFVIGCPGENKEQMQRTIDFACELGLDGAQFAIMTPYPGTPLWKLCEEKGYLKKDLQMKDLLVHGNCNIATPDFTPEEIIEIQRRAYSIFEYRRWEKKTLTSKTIYLYKKILRTLFALLVSPRKIIELSSKLRIYGSILKQC